MLGTVGDGPSFLPAAYLASCAGLAPTVKLSGTLIHGEHAPTGGSRQLERDPRAGERVEAAGGLLIGRSA